MTATEYVILVDEQDQEIGLAEKLKAHELNLLHRAFSVFILRRQNGQVEVLLQQRALSKYHSPGLWTNTCCSHPRQGESIPAAANRRLAEEMGMQAELALIGHFHYNAHFDNGLSENEMDHVLIAWVENNISIQPNPQEVHAIKWISISDLETALTSHLELFTPWLKPALALVKESIEK